MKAMTPQRFQKCRRSIEGEKFWCKETNPLLYGAERAAFEKKQLERLIVAAEGIEALTVKRKVEGWRRRIARLEEAQKRLQQRHEEMQPIG